MRCVGVQTAVDGLQLGVVEQRLQVGAGEPFGGRRQLPQVHVSIQNQTDTQNLQDLHTVLLQAGRQSV